MPTRNHEHGLEMVNLPTEIEQVCGTAHDRFCQQHDLQDWDLRVIQPQQDVVKIVSTAPIGGTVQQTTFRPGRNFGEHVTHVLESHFSLFEHYRKQRAHQQ
jgi:hypothetical protein